MNSKADAKLAALLRAALKERGYKQRTLAKELGTTAPQVSLLANGKAPISLQLAKSIDKILHTKLVDAYLAADKHFEMYLSSPITGLAAHSVRDENHKVAQVFAAAQKYSPSIYWPGQSIVRTDQLKAPDIATAENLNVLVNANSFLYIQFEEVIRPTGSLIELGIALGRNIKTTVILQKGLPRPFMLSQGFQGVVKDNEFLPDARIYDVTSPEAACILIEQTGREIFGLDPLQSLSDDGQPELNFED